jgi:molybdopterin converting factor small subunit
VRVTIRLFARLRELVGTGELVREVAGPATIETVWRELASSFPEIEPYAASISVARNFAYARMSTPIADDDEVAFLPPVSGGAT